ncbi:hypothetical protein MCOR29_003782 [Pyricularia oryzae]|nr:hypothetical protein MCOR01_008084 [Pyricularia oryzae]KAI6320399.1 hypothetical protein MCOR34_002964 [Pyricularia oryzae]KAI6325388.1 hypothetical protein MCOR29_003782 [Pyricularia oryzae]KAI6406708.1 hypothetical protein MCOR23_002123 [Pyricularia oryzae]KAI6427047.1 hypothetical protein MCOR24_002629 [Pyricularia oryzae]
MEQRHENGAVNNDNPIPYWRGCAVDTTQTTDCNQWSWPFAFPNTLPLEYHNDTVSDWSQLLNAAADSVNQLDSHDQRSPGYDAFESVLSADAPSPEKFSPSTATTRTALPIMPCNENQWSPHAIFESVMTAGQLTTCDNTKMESEPLHSYSEPRPAPPQHSDSPETALGDAELVTPPPPWQADTLMPHQGQGLNLAATSQPLAVCGCAESPASTPTTLPSSLDGIQIQYLSESELKKNDLRRRNRMAASKARGLKREVAKHESFGVRLFVDYI